MSQLFEEKTIRLKDPDYPPLLAHIADPPKVLHVRGNKKILQSPSLAIVGSRNATAYGKKYAQILGADLAKAGFCIVSGLAYGIDSWAHESALEHGQAIGAVAGGLNAPLQSWQTSIAERILKGGGALVSEFPLATPALKHHFPLRNRIIAGLSYGTLVIEASEKSGALITAKAALDCGRSVFALPGDIDRATSAGAIELIRGGAVPVRCALDIKNELINQLPQELLSRLPKDPSEDILAALQKKKSDINGLAQTLDQAPEKLLPRLSQLEIDGQIRRQPDGTFVLKI